MESPAIVWVSQISAKGEQRLALSECPVSYVSGESLSFLEDFVAHVELGGGEDPRRWPARRVDAFRVLYRELRQMENRERA